MVHAFSYNEFLSSKSSVLSTETPNDDLKIFGYKKDVSPLLLSQRARTHEEFIRDLREAKPMKISPFTGKPFKEFNPSCNLRSIYGGASYNIENISGIDVNFKEVKDYQFTDGNFRNTKKMVFTSKNQWNDFLRKVTSIIRHGFPENDNCGLRYKVNGNSYSVNSAGVLSIASRVKIEKWTCASWDVPCIRNGALTSCREEMKTEVDNSSTNITTKVTPSIKLGKPALNIELIRGSTTSGGAFSNLSSLLTFGLSNKHMDESSAALANLFIPANLSQYFNFDSGSNNDRKFQVESFKFKDMETGRKEFQRKHPELIMTAELELIENSICNLAKKIRGEYDPPYKHKPSSDGRGVHRY